MAHHRAGAVRFIPTPVGNTQPSTASSTPMPVHPHARGEHAHMNLAEDVVRGSSPRPWGTLLGDHRILGGSRFIPTPVGNTGAGGAAGCAVPVHPHARGEHVLVALHAQHAGRFIPTPVGNTAAPPARLPRASVHPHARGEHQVDEADNDRHSGSSPRPWGTRGARSRAARSRAVHPHARGEHGVTEVLSSDGTGSSPRPWGTLVGHVLDVGLQRFIPTPVGNTRSSQPGAQRGPVHPHARGEHLSPALSKHGFSGSSPRPWGTPTGRMPASRGTRFIPTPVGNTASRRAARCWKPVHPHARGEHGVMYSVLLPAGGSSPRPWGTRVTAAADEESSRFIPTPVGNTVHLGQRIQQVSVHPHARGEHRGRNRTAARCGGSSPRPWGTLLGRRLSE